MKATTRKQFLLFTIFLSIPCLFYLSVGLVRGFCTPGDGHLRWQEAAYLLRRIYPMDIVFKNINPLPEIGYLNSDITTVPWAYLLSNLLYPGIFPWNYTKLYTILVFFVMSFFVIRMILRHFRFQENAPFLSLFPVIVLFSQFGWQSGLSKLNNGIFVCLSLLLVVLLLEYCPKNLSYDFALSVLMTLAMLKPQIALLFYIPLLWQKRFLPILLSGLTLSASWLIVSALCHRSPLVILADQFQVGANLDTISFFSYYGLFDFLLAFGVSTTLLMLCQMLVFGLIALIAGWFLRNNSNWIQCSIPALFSILWCYNHNMDLAIVGVLMIACSYLLISGNLSKPETYYLIFLLCFNVLPLTHSLYELSPLIPFIQRIFYLAGLGILLRNRKKFPSP